MPSDLPSAGAEAILDASAIMAVVFQEPGEAVVRGIGRETAASAVNISEVYARAVERGSTEALVGLAISTLAINVCQFDALDALEAARLRPRTRHLGLSLGDRACLALAQRLGLPVLTADRRWAKLDIGVEVRLIR
jgi:PIN domain nuclease of toxin-antitoxin system